MRSGITFATAIIFSTKYTKMQSLNEKLAELSSRSDEICVTIALPTHRTHPDNKQDEVKLKNLGAEAEKNVVSRFGKREAGRVLEILETTIGDIDHNYNLDSLHLFVSENTTAVVRLPFLIKNSEVIINDRFDVHYLEEALENSREYLLLVLSQGGVQLFDAMNDSIVSEIRSEGFPMTQNKHYITHADKASDPKQVDNQVREYFNKVDKAALEVHRRTKLPVVVTATPRNYEHLMAVADRRSIYVGNSRINYNDTKPDTLGTNAWDLLQEQND